MTLRRLAVVAGALVLLLAVGAGGVWYGEQAGRSAAAEAVARVQEVEARLRESEARQAQHAEARARAEARAGIAEEELRRIATTKAQVPVEVRRPKPPAERARQVRAAIAVVAPEVLTSTSSIVPLEHGGRRGFWVAEAQFVVMEEALRLRPVLDAEIAALTRLADARNDRAEAAIAENAELRLEVGILRPAWANAETELADARAEAGLPPWAEYAGAGLAVAVAVGTFLLGQATAAPAVVVR